MAEPVPTSAKGYTHVPSPSWWSGDLDAEETPELIWPASVNVYDTMRRTDSQVISVLRAVTLPIRRTGWRIDPNGASEEAVELVSQDLGLPVIGAERKAPLRTKGRFSWKHHLYLALLMLPFGHSFFEQVYRIDERGRARLRKLEWRPPTTISKINVERDGGLESIEQTAEIGSNAQAPKIEVGRLVAYVNEREGGNWLGKSLLRPAFKDWLIKDQLLRVEAQTAIRNGMGIPVYEASKVPDGILSEEAIRKYIADEIAAGQQIAAEWAAGENSGSSIPNGAKVSLVGVSGNLPDVNGPIRARDEGIARAVLANFLTLGGDKSTGSYALGETFANFFVRALQTVAEDIADIANQHIVEDLIDLNFGEDAIAPRIVFDEIGSRHPATAQAVQMLVQCGAIRPTRALEEHLLTQYGLPAWDGEAPMGPSPQESAFQQLAAAIAAHLQTAAQTSDEGTAP